MERNDKKNDNIKDNSTDENQKNAVNPFNERENQTIAQETLEEEAEAEQQRKEALTERD